MACDVLWLDDPACGELALAGGKAANLSRLAAVHPVPPGFCISASALARAARSCAPPALPGDLRDIILAAYVQLGARCGSRDPGVAVRSSAVGTMSLTASARDAAGQSQASRFSLPVR